MIYKDLAQIYDEAMTSFNYEGWYEKFHAILSDLGIKKDRVLDIGCGSGNFTKLLRGFSSVVAIDPSDSMLSQAKKVLGDEPSMTFMACKLEDLPSDMTFHAMTMVADGMHYMSDETTLERFFEHVKSRLEANGVFMFDLRQREAFLDELGVYIEETEKGYCVYEYGEDLPFGTIDVTGFYQDDGECYHKFKEFHRLRLWTKEEIRDIAEKVGLEIERVSLFDVSLEEDFEDLRHFFVLRRIYENER